MELTSKKLEHIIKEEITKILEQEKQKQVTSTAISDQEEKGKINNTLDALIQKMSRHQQKEYFAYARPRIKKGAIEGFRQMLKFAKKAVQGSEPQMKKSSAPAPKKAQPAPKKAQAPKKAAPSGKKAAIQKVRELQAALVKAGIAPELINGKPFVDGILRDKTLAYIRKIYK